MALRILKNNSRGSALLETLPVSAMIAAFVVSMLTLAYLMFAQAYVRSEGERALYCIAENRSEPLCRRELRTRIKSALPFGEISRVQLSGGAENWTIELEWKWSEFKIRVAKRLRIKDITGSRVLQW